MDSNPPPAPIFKPLPREKMIGLIQCLRRLAAGRPLPNDSLFVIEAARRMGLPIQNYQVIENLAPEQWETVRAEVEEECRPLGIVVPAEVLKPQKSPEESGKEAGLFLEKIQSDARDYLKQFAGLMETGSRLTERCKQLGAARDPASTADALLLIDDFLRTQTGDTFHEVRSVIFYAAMRILQKGEEANQAVERVYDGWFYGVELKYFEATRNDMFRICKAGLERLKELNGPAAVPPAEKAPEKPPEPPSARRRRRNTKSEPKHWHKTAVRYLKATQGEIPDSEIARLSGVSPSVLSRDKIYQALRQSFVAKKPLKQFFKKSDPAFSPMKDDE